MDARRGLLRGRECYGVKNERRCHYRTNRPTEDSKCLPFIHCLFLWFPGRLSKKEGVPSSLVGLVSAKETWASLADAGIV